MAPNWFPCAYKCCNCATHHVSSIQSYAQQTTLYPHRWFALPRNAGHIYHPQRIAWHWPFRGNFRSRWSWFVADAVQMIPLRLTCYCSMLPVGVLDRVCVVLYTHGPIWCRSHRFAAYLFRRSIEHALHTAPAHHHIHRWPHIGSGWIVRLLDARHYDAFSCHRLERALRLCFSIWWRNILLAVQLGWSRACLKHLRRTTIFPTDAFYLMMFLGGGRLGCFLFCVKKKWIFLSFGWLAHVQKSIDMWTKCLFCSYRE